MHVNGGSPLTWLMDRFASEGVRRTHVARAATAYLTHLLESNSHRVENDLKERTRVSRRWLEGQIRVRLAGALQSAERALTVAVDKQHLSEAEVRKRLERVRARRGELAILGGAPLFEPRKGWNEAIGHHRTSGRNPRRRSIMDAGRERNREAIRTE